MKTLTESAQTAKAIRQLLKHQYPTIRFSVTSRNFAGGNAVDIEWNLGPTTKKVEDLVNGFEYGHFNGMEDIYEYSNVRENMPQAKYVQTRRNYYTQEEIDNYKIDWRSPARKDLHKEEKTLYHQIGRDICKASGIEYQGLNTPVRQSEVFCRCVRGDVNFLQDCIYQLISNTDFMNGYHGITNQLAEDGSPIKNCFMAY